MCLYRKHIQKYFFRIKVTINVNHAVDAEAGEEGEEATPPPPTDSKVLGKQRKSSINLVEEIKLIQQVELAHGAFLK